MGTNLGINNSKNVHLLMTRTIHENARPFLFKDIPYLAYTHIQQFRPKTDE